MCEKLNIKRILKRIKNILSLIAFILLLVSCTNQVESDLETSIHPVLQIQVALSGADGQQLATRTSDSGTDAERIMSNYYIFIYEGSSPDDNALPLYAIKNNDEFQPVVFATDGQNQTLAIINDDQGLLEAINKNISVAIVANVPDRNIESANGTYNDYLKGNYQSLSFKQFKELYEDLTAIERSSKADNAKLIYSGIAIYNIDNSQTKIHTIPVTLTRNMARVNLNLSHDISNVLQGEDGLKLLTMRIRGERRYGLIHASDVEQELFPDDIDINEIINNRSFSNETSFYTMPTLADGTQKLSMEFVVQLTHSDGSTSERSLSVEMVNEDGSNIILKRNYSYNIDVKFLDHNYTIELKVSSWNSEVHNDWDGEVDNGEVIPIEQLNISLNRQNGNGINGLGNGTQFYSLSPAGNYSNFVTAHITGGVAPLEVVWYYKSIYDNEFKVMQRTRYNQYLIDGNGVEYIEENYEHIIYDHNDIRGELYCEVIDAVANSAKTSNLDLFVKRTFFGSSTDDYVTFQNSTSYLATEKQLIENAGTAVNRVRYLRDARDNKVYRVKLMTNGVWVMVSDLEYNNLVEKPASSDNGYIYQGIASTYPKEGGYLYSGPRAVGQRSVSNIGDGICPDGWTLPVCSDLGPWFGATSTTSGFSIKGELVVEYSKGYDDLDSKHFEFANVQWTNSSSSWPGNNANNTYGHYWLKENVYGLLGILNTSSIYAFRIFSTSTSGFMNSCSFTQYNAVRCIKK